MVGAVKLAGVFDRQHVTGIHDHTDQRRVAPGTTANVAEVAVWNIVAAGAKAGFGAHGQQGVGQRAGLRLLPFQQVQREAQGGFFANAGQFRNLVDGIFNQLRRVIHKLAGVE